MMNRFEIAEGLHSEQESIRGEALVALIQTLDKFIYQVIHELNISKSNMEDAYSCCKVAIMKYSDRYDPEKGQLTTYFKPIIKKACVEYISDACYGQNAYYANMIRKVNEAEIKLRNLNRKVTLESISDISGLSLTKVRKARQMMRQAQTKEDTSYDTVNPEHENQETPEKALIDAYMKELIVNTIFGFMTEQQMEMFTRKYLLYGEDVSDQRVAKGMGLPVHIVTREMEKAKRALYKVRKQDRMVG